MYTLHWIFSSFYNKVEITCEKCLCTWYDETQHKWHTQEEEDGS